MDDEDVDVLYDDVLLLLVLPLPVSVLLTVLVLPVLSPSPSRVTNTPPDLPRVGSERTTTFPFVSEDPKVSVWTRGGILNRESQCRDHIVADGPPGTLPPRNKDTIVLE